MPVSSECVFVTWSDCRFGLHANSPVNQPCTYLCGNSLGALAKRSEELVKEEMEVWATRCVQVALRPVFC